MKFNPEIITGRIDLTISKIENGNIYGGILSIIDTITKIVGDLEGRDSMTYHDLNDKQNKINNRLSENMIKYDKETIRKITDMLYYIRGRSDNSDIFNTITGLRDVLDELNKLINDKYVKLDIEKIIRTINIYLEVKF